MAIIPAKTKSEFARFTRAQLAVKPRIIGRSTGEPGSGKTRWWLGAPAPIVVFSFDQGLEGVVEEFQEKKPIYFKEYQWAPTDSLGQEEAELLLKDYLASYEEALQIARTVVIDKETDLWELFRYAEFGEPNDAPRNYPKLNQRVRKYINMPKALNLNVGFIEAMKDEWKNYSKTTASGEVKTAGASTGNRIPQGFSELEALVHINIHHRREKVVENGVTSSLFAIDIGKARGPASARIQDQTFAPSLSFSEFGQYAFPGSSESDWE